MIVDRYKVNDVLTALASDLGVTLTDDALNEVSHHVADVLDAASRKDLMNEQDVMDALLYLRKQAPAQFEPGYIPDKEWQHAMKIARGEVTE